MKKITILITFLFLVLGGYFYAKPVFVHAQTLDDIEVAGAGGGSILGGEQTKIEEALGGCNIITSFSLCVLWFIYHVILGFSFWIAGIAGKLFDFFISYSLNSEAYNSQFIVKGWGVIRDIANVAFIFTILYLAIRNILGLDGKRHLPTLIIVAILLNFSLFFTKIVIDAGNILARAFYNSINIENDQYAGEIGFKSISVGLLDKINPQELLTEQLFNPKIVTGTGDYSTTSGTLTSTSFENPNYFQRNLNENFGYFTLIFLLLAGINFVLAWVFLSVALLFLGRVVGLWFSMIFAPIAFITLAIPGSSGFVKQLSFDSWKDTTLKLAFLAPIFLFFLYLTIMFMDIFFKTTIASADRDTFMMIMKIFIPFMFIFVILTRSKKIAEEMAGEFGGAMKKLVGTVAGFAGGIALGGAAFAGRRVIGGAASSALRSGAYNTRIADVQRRLQDPSTDMAQRALLEKELYSLESTKTRLQKWKDSSFDIRNAHKSTMLWGGVGKVSGALGKQVRSGMTGFGGQDFNVGKGSKESRGKFESEQEEKKLKYAEDVSSVSYNERGGVIANQRKIVRDELFALSEQKKVIERGFENKTNAITQRLDQLVNKQGPLTSDEAKESLMLKSRKTEIEEKKRQKLKEVDDKIKKADIRNDEDALIKKEIKERRGLVASYTEGQDLWGAIMGVDNKEIARSIRKEKPSKSDAEKFSELAKKMVKDEEAKTKPPPPPPPQTP